MTMRTRLTLLNAAVFALLGSTLLVINWISVRDLLHTHRDVAVPTMPAVPMAAPPSDSVQIPAAVTTPAERFDAFERAFLTDLLVRSVVVLVVLTALAALLAWWTSRRSLRRVGEVTNAARRINDGNLHDRLALTGPRDEIKELGDTFDAMLDRLDRSFADQRRFTAHASHELRTPLTLQRTALEIPLAQGRVPADLAPAIRRALEATARSERLIASLLALARGESGMAHPRPVDLADAARRAFTDVRVEAEAEDVTIETDLHAAPAEGDPVLLDQLVLNLLTNAVRHNLPGGRVHLTTGMTGDNTAVITVTNTGPPVDPADLPTLFEPFQRRAAGPQSSQRPGAQGAGLGLTVVRAITDTHHATLNASPNPGGGLTVRVRVPPAQQGTACTPSALARSTSAARTPTPPLSAAEAEQRSSSCLP
ncbi:sensor histidine kinase [Micromonospora sp. NBC_01412]|uniref:sensor histidine kinase n=1 Tax=Micromonospora sp. NBC_01412 TaxID=2903590 RepID=UPI0032484D5A